MSHPLKLEPSDAWPEGSKADLERRGGKKQSCICPIGAGADMPISQAPGLPDPISCPEGQVRFRRPRDLFCWAPRALEGSRDTPVAIKYCVRPKTFPVYVFSHICINFKWGSTNYL